MNSFEGRMWVCNAGVKQCLQFFKKCRIRLVLQSLWRLHSQSISMFKGSPWLWEAWLEQCLPIFENCSIRAWTHLKAGSSCEKLDWNSLCQSLRTVASEHGLVWRRGSSREKFDWNSLCQSLFQPWEVWLEQPLPIFVPAVRSLTGTAFANLWEL